MPFKSDEDVRNYVRKRRRMNKNCSVSHLRRTLNVGYKKAKRIADEVEEELRKEVAEHPERAHLLVPAPPKRGKKRPRKEIESSEEGEKKDEGTPGANHTTTAADTEKGEGDQEEKDTGEDDEEEKGSPQKKKTRRKPKKRGWARKKRTTRRFDEEEHEDEEENEEEEAKPSRRSSRRKKPLKEDDSDHEKDQEKELCIDEDRDDEEADEAIRQHVSKKLEQGEVIYVNEMRTLFPNIAYQQARRVVQEFVDSGKIQKLPKGYGSPTLQLPKVRVVSDQHR